MRPLLPALALALVPGLALAQSGPAGLSAPTLPYGAAYGGSSSGSTLLKGAPSASGILTLPAATDTLVGRATADTLTNKLIDASQLTGTVPSGVIGGAWSTFAPSPSTASGTVTTWGAHVGRYTQVGKTIHVMVIVRITTNGSGAGHVRVPLPVTPRTGWRGGCSGWRGDASQILSAFTYADGSTAGMYIFAPNSAYPGADGAELWMSCTYEAA